MPPLLVHFRRLHPSAHLPRYGSANAAGLDIAAHAADPIVIEPGQRAKVATGIAVELPSGHEMQLRCRSGMAANHGIMMVNAPGTIDEDYRGEIFVLLYNSGSEPFVIEHGDRIAQAIIAPVPRVEIVEIYTTGETERGTGAFGSTGR